MSEKCRKNWIRSEKPDPFDRSMDIAEVLKLADELLFAHTGDRPKPIREFRSAIATRNVVKHHHSLLEIGIRCTLHSSSEADFYPFPHHRPIAQN